jgi:hypothetical protein
VSGNTIDGTLVVVNRGSPVNLTKSCRPDYVVVLTNAKYAPQVAFTSDCLAQPFTIRTGTNRLPIHVLTTYLVCHPPACTSDLPAGNYDAVLVGNGLALPEPKPISVTLSEGSA